VFRGANALSLDAKGRMTIPTRYRDLLSSSCQGRLVATVDRGPCLLLYPQPKWEVLEKQLSEFPNFDQQTRRVQRLLIGHATECEMDGQGRILLPPTLREFAGLDKHVMLIGQVQKFELWDEQAWAEQCKRLLETPDDASLSDYLNTLSL
jgi:MraZ protein